MIELIITGGTIAKKYDEIKGELVFDETHLQKMLSQARVDMPFRISTLFLKDSLEMDDRDREKILTHVTNSSFKKILILHGTDTMTKSAKTLHPVKDKTIILTGAMIPYAFKNSDALFNLGFALGALEIEKNGVFIAMNGRLFGANMVKKDKNRGVFVEI
jgi:L-asparaginase